MKIERIERKGRRALIWLENGEYLRVFPTVVYDNSLRKGDDLSEEKIKLLNESNEKIRLNNSAMRILSARDHSISEFRKKLISKGYDSVLVGNLIDKFIDLQLLDDRKFTVKYVEYLKRIKKFGNNKIKSVLFSKGIKNSLINEVLIETEDKVIDDENIKELILKKYRLLKHKNLDKTKLKQKIYQFLISKGFDFSSCKSYVDEFLRKVSEGQSDE